MDVLQQIKAVIEEALPGIPQSDLSSVINVFEQHGVTSVDDLKDFRPEYLESYLSNSKAEKLKTVLIKRVSNRPTSRPGVSTSQNQAIGAVFKSLVDKWSREEVVEKIKKPCYRLLLLGKTGEGKSATGNTILGKKTFKSTADTESVTKDVSDSYAEHDDVSFKVTDGPGTADTTLDKVEYVKKAISDMTKAITRCTEGFHALLMIYRFGHRFTKEDEDSIEFLKTLLGKEVFKNHGICVVTNGDHFKSDMENDGTPGMTFEDWCENQKKKSKGNDRYSFTSLLEECGNRVILFDNRTKDKEKRSHQIQSLLHIIKHMPCGQELYTNREFEKMNEERKRLIKVLNLPQMKENFKETMTLFEDVLIKTELTSQNTSNIPQNIKEKAIDLIKVIDKEDGGTKVLLPLKDKLSGLVPNVDDMEKMEKERLRLQHELDESTRKLQMEKEKFKEQELKLNLERKSLQAEKDDMHRRLQMEKEKYVHQRELDEIKLKSQLEEQRSQLKHDEADQREKQIQFDKEKQQELKNKLSQLTVENQKLVNEKEIEEKKLKLQIEEQKKILKKKEEEEKILKEKINKVKEKSKESSEMAKNNKREVMEKIEDLNKTVENSSFWNNLISNGKWVLGDVMGFKWAK